VRPALCLITDRRRFGDDWERATVALVREAAASGVDLIQVRERDLDGGPLVRLVRACIAAARGTRTRVLVNDRLDVALAAGAHGVHLRADSIPGARVRQIAPRGFLVGRSIHSIAEAAGAEVTRGLDYLMFGTVFDSSSKPGREAAGLATLAAVADATTLPVIAVGGVTVARAGEAVRAGASGIAAIGMFADSAPADLRAIVERLDSSFDRPRRVP
jgi:thiamine-phosphate diphosphorylase